MYDPYSVLGISQNATEEQIKNAYRSLARQHHPDNFDDATMKQMAQQKMNEINQAYDTIISQKKRGGGSSNYSNDSEFPEIYQCIQVKNYEQAQLLLDQVPIPRRNARWYYLSGETMYGRGWYDNAYTNYATAARLDPQNQEYQHAVEKMNRNFNGNGYRTRSFEQNNRGGGLACSPCDICQALICADCCCECMGSDCIPCC